MARRTPSLSLQQIHAVAPVVRPAPLRVPRKLVIDDMFAGVGGASTGCVAACLDTGHPYEMRAFNHWDLALKTHKRNHPEIDTY